MILISMKANRFKTALLCTVFSVVVLCSVFLIGTAQAFAYDESDYVTVISPEGLEEHYDLPEKQNSFEVESVNTNSVKLKWHNPWGSYPDGYEISTYNSSKNEYTAVAYSTKESCRVKGLNSGKKYTFAVRGYKEIYGVKYYGPYSELLNAATSPAAASLTSVKYKSQGKMLVKWKKVSGATGYIIQYSTGSKFSDNGTTCTVIVSGEGKTSKEIGALAKKKYYVRVCAYKSNGDKKFAGKWSKVKTVSIKKGVSLKTAINYTKTDLSGRKFIKEYTNNDVDIKKYKTTYDRIKAIYTWHARHAKEFESCLACNSNFASCVNALYADNKKYDVFIRIAADRYKNSNGSVVMHKWPVMYVSGVPYICDPRMQGYTGRYTANDYFGLSSGKGLAKQYKFDYWFSTWTRASRYNIVKYAE